MNEILARPPRPLTESIARVRIEGERVRVFFPEIRDDFKRVVKQLLYGWCDPVYARTFADGAIRLHRAAELVRDLLAAGFVVKADEALVRMAAAGDFAPEPRRWVTASASGWFLLGWFRDEDCYRAAKSLPGSRYEAPHVVVPPEHFEDVLDFADVYQFHVMLDAHQLVDAARAEREMAVIVYVAPASDRQLPPPMSGAPRALGIPERVDIDDDLID